MSNIEHSQGYWTVENLTERLAERSNQLLSARDKIDTLTDEVEYLDQRLQGAVDALSDLLDALDNSGHLSSDPEWAAIVKARDELRRLRGGQ